MDPIPEVWLRGPLPGIQPYLQPAAHTLQQVREDIEPEVQGLLEGYRTSRAYVVEHRDSFERAGQAVLAKIMSHEGAAAALKEGMQASVALNSPNAPDLNKAAKEMG